MDTSEMSLGARVGNVNAETSLDKLIELNKVACDSFLNQLGIVEELDNAVAKIDATRTPAYHELGRQAVALKKSLGHGGWGPYLKRINRSQRTVNRAMTIYIAFPDKQKSAKWIALSLIDAEEKARNVVAKTTGKARTPRKPKSSEGQGTPKETPVVLDKSKSLEPKVNVQQEVVGSLADKQTIAESGSVGAKPQEQPAEASHVVPDAVANGKADEARECFEEEVARSLMSDDPSEEEISAYCIYSDGIGSVDRAFQVALKMFWYFAEATIRVGGSASAEFRASNDLRGVLGLLQTITPPIQAASVTKHAANQATATTESETATVESDLPQKPR